MAGQQIDIVANLLVKVDNAEAGINKLKNSLSKLKMPDNLSNNFKKSFANLDTIFARYKSQVEKGFETKADVSNFMKTGKQLDAELNRISKYFTELSGKEIDFKVRDDKLVEAEKKLQDIVKEKDELGKNTLSLKVDSKGIKSEVDNVKALLTTFQNIAGNTKVGQAAGNALFDLDAGNIKQAKVAVEQISESYKRLGDNKKNAFKQETGIDMSTAITALLEILKTTEGEFDTLNGKAKAAKEEVNGLSGQNINNAANLVAKLTAEFDNQGSTIRGVNGELQSYAQSMQSMSQQLGDLQRSTQYFFSLRNMINLLKRGIREVIQTVKDLDKAMTETAVVTSYSVDDMWAKLPEYTKNANALGATVLDMYKSTTLYYQQGLNTEQAMSIAAETMKMARIAGLEAADATDMMTAALRGFNMEINETSAQRINDVYSNLAAKTASNTQEIGKAMQRTASIAASAGMSFEGTAAFLAQAIETTREPAENIGTAMKTIVARFTELKKNPLEIAEVDGEEVSYNKVDTALQSIGVSLKDANGQFRELDQVFLDISQRWDSLSQTQQRYIATVAAGSRQQSRFIAMMSNYERTTELMDYATNSEGASQEQFGKTLESLEAKINKFQNAWKEFLMGIMDSSWIKFIVDAGTTVLNIVNKIIDALSFNGSAKGIKSFLSLFTAFTGLKMAGRGVNALIGGLGGMLDPNSTWSAGAKAGGIRSRAGGNPVLAAQISNPIVSAIQQASGKIAQSNQSNIRDQHYAFKEARAGMMALSKGSFTVTDIQNQLSGLTNSNQNALMKSFSGTAFTMRNALMNNLFNQEGVTPEIKKALQGAEQNIAEARNLGALSWKEYWGAISDERQIKKALNKNQPGAEAAAAILDNITKGIEAKGQTAYNGAAQEMTSKIISSFAEVGAEGADEYIASKEGQAKIHAYGEQARKAAEAKAREEAMGGVSATNSKAASFLNKIGSLGSGVASVGMGLQAFASTLTSSANPALQAFGAALSSVGGMIYGLGMGISSISSGISAIASSQIMKSLADGASALTGLTIGAGALTGVFAAVAAVIGITVFAIKKHNENLKKAAEEVPKKFKEVNDNTQSNISKLEEAKAEFARLSEGVDANGNNVSLDSSEYSRYKEIVSLIASLNPSIVEGYNAQGDAIIRNNEALEQTIQLQRQLQKEAAQEYISPSSLAVVLKGRDTNQGTKSGFEKAGTQSWGFSGEDSSYAATVKLVRALARADINQAQFEEKFDLEGLFDYNTEAIYKLFKNIDKTSSYLNSLNISDDDRAKIQSAVLEVSAKLGEFNEANSEAYQILSTYATEQGYGLNIPSAYQEAFQNGIHNIVESDLGVDEMYKAVDDLYFNLAQNLGKNSKIKKAQEEIIKAQEEYAKDLDETAYNIKMNDIKGTYEEVIAKYRSLFEETGDETYNILAEALQNELAQAEDITNTSLASLGQAFDTMASHINNLKEAANNFGDVAERVDPNAGASYLKSIYDVIYDENSTHALLHDAVYWQGTQEFIDKGIYDSGDTDVIDAIMKKIEPTLQEGVEGVQAAKDFLWQGADGVYIKQLPDGEIEVNIANEEELAEAAQLYGVTPDVLAAELKRVSPLGLDFADYDAIRKAYINDERVKKGPEVGEGETRRLLISEDTARSDAYAGGKSPDQFYDEVLPGLEKVGVDVLPKLVKTTEEQQGNEDEVRKILTDFGVTESNYIQELIDVVPKEELELIGETLYGTSPEDFDEIYDNALLEDENQLDAYRNDKLDEITSILSAWAKEAGYDTISQGDATEKDFVSGDFKEGFFGDNGVINNWLKGLDANGDSFVDAGAAMQELTSYASQLQEYKDLLTKGLDKTTSPEQQEAYKAEIQEVDNLLKMLGSLGFYANDILNDNMLGTITPENLGSLLQTQLEKTDWFDIDDVNSWNKLITDLLKGGVPDTEPDKNDTTIDYNDVPPFKPTSPSQFDRNDVPPFGSTSPFSFDPSKFDPDTAPGGLNWTPTVNKIFGWIVEQFSDVTNLNPDEVASQVNTKGAITGLISQIIQNAIVNAGGTGTSDLNTSGLQRGDTQAKNIGSWFELIGNSIINAEDTASSLNISPDNNPLTTGADDAASTLTNFWNKILKINVPKTGNPTPKISSNTGSTPTNKGGGKSGGTKTTGGTVNTSAISSATNKIANTTAKISVQVKDDTTPGLNAIRRKIRENPVSMPVRAGIGGNGKANGQNNRIHITSLPSFGSLARGTKSRYGQIGPRNKGGLTLTGEKGFEIAWLPSENRSMILGSQGPQMLSLPSNAVVYTHEQSKKIIKQKSIPAGSHVAKGRTTAIPDGSTGRIKGTTKNKNKSSGANSKDKTKNYNHFSIEEVIRFDIDQSLSWLNYELEKKAKEIETSLNKIGMIYDDIADSVNNQLDGLKEARDYNEQLLASYQKQLAAIDAGPYKEVISWTTAAGKSKNKTYDLSQYIYKDEEGTYKIDVDQLQKQVKDNREREAIFKATNNLVSQFQQNIIKTQKEIDNIDQQMEELGQKVSETFYQWENELTEIYDLTQRIADETSFTDRFMSQVELELSKLNTGFGETAKSIENIRKVLLRNNDNIQRQIEDQQQMIAARQRELNRMLSSADEQERLDRFQNATGVDEATKAANIAWAEDQKKIADTALKYVTNIYRDIDGSVRYAIDWEGFNRDNTNSPFNEETYNAIKDYLDDLNDAATEFNDSIKEQTDFIKDTYEALADYQKTVVDMEETLIKGVEEEIKNETDNAKKLSDSIRDQLKDLLDEVKRRLDERRKQEDNLKTERDISQKQQRLAALRADTAGGHQVEIAQLEKEIAEAQQNYGRTLEDQLLDRLQQQADEAAKQRERQIELAEKSNEINASTNKELVDLWLKNPEAYKEEIRSAWLEAQGYDEKGEAGQWKLEQEFESEFAKLVTAVEQSGFNNVEQIFSATAEDVSTLVNLVNQLVNGGISREDELAKDLNAETDATIHNTESILTLSKDIEGAKRAKELGASAKVLKDNGFSLNDLIGDPDNPTYDIAELREAGYTAQELKDAGIDDASRLRGGGYDAAELKDADFDLSDLIGAGFTAKDLKDLFTPDVLKELFSPSALKEADFTAQELADKFDINQLRDAGYSLPELKEAFSAEDFGANGISYTDARAAGYTAQELKDVAAYAEEATKEIEAATKLANNYPYGKASATTGKIKSGSSGNQVKAIQWALRQMGYKGKNGKPLSIDGKFGANTVYAVKAFQKAMKITADGVVGNQTRAKFKAKGYATGGLADYTGPAWLDGTPSKPELVLNAADTKNFLALRDVLSSAMKSTGAINNSYGGDVTYEVNINVDKLTSDYDVDKVANRVKQIIVKDSSYRNVTQARNFR